jgi:hypothetical protein
LAERFAVLLEDRPLLIRAVTWATINWLLDAASLWVFVAAFSHFISPIDLLVAYGLANILAAIPITPGGLGVVEFVLVSMITGFGPTAGQALSGVLAYRAINFWLPIPFGGLAYASLEFERGALYRRLHLFFLHRYQRRRGALGVEDGTEDEPGRPVDADSPGRPTTPGEDEPGRPTTPGEDEPGRPATAGADSVGTGTVDAEPDPGSSAPRAPDPGSAQVERQGRVHLSLNASGPVRPEKKGAGAPQGDVSTDGETANGTDVAQVPPSQSAPEDQHRPGSEHASGRPAAGGPGG